MGRLRGQRLQNPLEEKDLGVSIILSTSEVHINQINTTAHGHLVNLGILLQHLSKESFTTLYAVCVRPILEYVALVRHIKKLEKVQMFATRLVPEIRGIPCKESLRKLYLMILEDRRDKGDMIMT